MGKMHINNMQTIKHAHITKVVDSSPDMAWLESRGIEGSTDLASITSDDSIEAVIIAASSSEHVQLIEQVAASGKAIFCEKPIGFTIEAILQAKKAVQTHGVKCQVGFNRRFDPSFASLREAVNLGQVGDVFSVKITNFDPRRPDLNFIPRSGGMFLDFNVHDFDTLRFISGLEIESVHAFGSNLVDPEIGRLGDIDTSVISCKLSSGAVATIASSREAVYGYDQRVEVLGRLGGIESQNQTPTTVTTLHESSIASEPLKTTFVERYKEAYRLQMKAFFEYISHPELPSPVNIDDTLCAVALSIAADKSYRENRVVSLQEII